MMKRKTSKNFIISLIAIPLIILVITLFMREIYKFNEGVYILSYFIGIIVVFWVIISPILGLVYIFTTPADYYKRSQPTYEELTRKQKQNSKQKLYSLQKKQLKPNNRKSITPTYEEIIRRDKQNRRQNLYAKRRKLDNEQKELVRYNLVCNHCHSIFKQSSKFCPYCGAINDNYVLPRQV